MHFSESLHLARIVVSVMAAAKEQETKQNDQAYVDEYLFDLADLVLAEDVGSTINVDVFAVICPVLGVPVYVSFQCHTSGHDASCACPSHHLK